MIREARAKPNFLIDRSDLEASMTNDKEVLVKMGKVMFRIDMNRSAPEIKGEERKEKWMEQKKNYIGDAKKLLRKMKEEGLTVVLDASTD